MEGCSGRILKKLLFTRFSLARNWKFLGAQLTRFICLQRTILDWGWAGIKGLPYYTKLRVNQITLNYVLIIIFVTLGLCIIQTYPSRLFSRFSQQNSIFSDFFPSCLFRYQSMRSQLVVRSAVGILIILLSIDTIPWDLK